MCHLGVPDRVHSSNICCSISFNFVEDRIPRCNGCATTYRSRWIFILAPLVGPRACLHPSRVRVDQQTGEDRVMRGLAKMRELDLRLARTTERARELKILARHAAEQAERAAAGVPTEKKVRNISTRRRPRTLLLRAFDIEVVRAPAIFLT